MLDLRTSIERCGDKIQRLVGARDSLKKQASSLRKRIRREERALLNMEKAQKIIQEVARETQQQLEYQIGELVSLCLETVFPDPYKLVVEFVEKRGKTEAEIWLENNRGERIKPTEAAGGGVVDVVSFGLRIALWSMLPESRRTNPVFVLDEPFRFVSRDLQPKIGEMLQEVSEKLGVQFIMVSHEEDLIESASRVFRVRKTRDGRSNVAMEGRARNEGQFQNQ